jgi:hypothetical protein
MPEPNQLGCAYQMDPLIDEIAASFAPVKQADKKPKKGACPV